MTIGVFILGVAVGALVGAVVGLFTFLLTVGAWSDWRSRSKLRPE